MIKNVILITIDSLRGDYINITEKNNYIPNISKLANQGIFFKKAIANTSFTDYSLPSIFTSNLPPILENTTTITQVLKKHGYYTIAFNPNPEGTSKIKNDFHVFDMMFTSERMTKFTIGQLKGFIGFLFSTKLKKYADKIIKFLTILFSPNYLSIVPTAEEITQKAINWVKENKNKKFFLWLHYMDVHSPYAPPDHHDKNELIYLLIKYRYFANKLTKKELEKIIQLYDQEIRYTDKHIGLLVEHLKRENLLEKSVIIITADHGEAFLEHGIFGHGKAIRQGQMTEIYLYDELIHVPLVIYGADKKLVIEHQFQLLNVAPTVCKILGIDVPPSFQGTSLKDFKTENIISNTNQYISYRTEKYKIIVNKSNKKIELYDLQNDPFEKNDVYTDNKKIAEKLKDEMLEKVIQLQKKNREIVRLKNKINKIKIEGMLNKSINYD